MKRNDQINIPQAREAMDKFKMQAAQEMGVSLDFVVIVQRTSSEKVYKSSR